jgi:hypothetical protein
MKIYRIRKDDRGLFYIQSRKWYWPFTYTWCTGYFETWKIAKDCVEAKLFTRFFNYDL